MEFNLQMLQKAAELEGGGRWKEMLSHCKDWALLEPSNLLSWQGIGDALAQLGQFEEAINMYQKGLEVAPVKPMEFIGGKLSAGPLWYRLGNAYTKLGNIDKAIDSFKKAAQIDPDVAEIWNNLGIAYVNSNQAQKADEAFKSGLGVAPRNITILANLGNLYALCGMKDGVESVYRIISKIDAKAADGFLKNATQTLANR
jgi:tetratricopeptide (TPR) repeat protein